MKKDDFVKQIAEKAQVTLSEVEDVLAAQASVVQEAVNEGDVTIPGLVKLSPAVRAARKGRNPKTGEEIQIAEKKVVKVKVLKPLADAIS